MASSIKSNRLPIMTLFLHATKDETKQKENPIFFCNLKKLLKFFQFHKKLGN
jgi:hypothetical protein